MIALGYPWKSKLRPLTAAANFKYFEALRKLRDFEIEINELETIFKIRSNDSLQRVITNRPNFDGYMNYVMVR